MTFTYVDVRGERVEVPLVLFTPICMPPEGFLLAYRLASGVVVGFDVARGEYREIPTGPAPAPARKRKRKRYLAWQASEAMIRDMFRALLDQGNYAMTLDEVRRETGVPRSTFYLALDECPPLAEMRDVYLMRRRARANPHQQGRRSTRAGASDDS